MSFPRHLRKKRPKPRPNSRPGRLDLTSVKLRSSALGRCRFVLALFYQRQLHLFAFTDYWLLFSCHLPLFSRPTPHAPRFTPYAPHSMPHDLRGPPWMPRAEPGTAPPPGGANMLRHATSSASGRSLASHVFGAS